MAEKAELAKTTAYRDISASSKKLWMKEQKMAMLNSEIKSLYQEFKQSGGNNAAVKKSLTVLLKTSQKLFDDSYTSQGAANEDDQDAATLISKGFKALLIKQGIQIKVWQLQRSYLKHLMGMFPKRFLI